MESLDVITIIVVILGLAAVYAAISIVRTFLTPKNKAKDREVRPAKHKEPEANSSSQILLPWEDNQNTTNNRLLWLQTDDADPFEYEQVLSYCNNNGFSYVRKLNMFTRDDVWVGSGFADSDKDGWRQTTRLAILVAPVVSDLTLLKKVDLMLSIADGLMSRHKARILDVNRDELTSQMRNYIRNEARLQTLIADYS